YLFLSGKPPADVIACCGPIIRTWQAREAIRRLNDWFKLRDCPKPQTMVFSDQAELFPVLRAAGCIRYEIGTCLGPCASECSLKEYHERVQAARGLLTGESREPLESLTKEMAAAATSLNFEKAAAARDRWERIAWLTKQLENLRASRRRHTFVYTVHGGQG